MNKTVLREKKSLILFILAFFVMTILFLQSKNPLWKGHLEIDIWDFYQTIGVYFKNRSFLSLKGNEILPGSLLFFFVPRVFCNGRGDYGSYLNGFIMVNFFLLGLHLWLYKKQTKFLNILLFLLIMLAYGPILFFRVELIVSFLVILSIYLWRKKQFILSTFSLGLAVGTKLYPIIFLPYYLLLCLSDKHRFKKLFFCLIFFLGGFLLPILVFFLLGGNYQKLLYSLTFHSEKPFSIESLWGTVYTGVFLILEKKPPALFGGYGLWGLKPEGFDISQSFLNWFSLLPVIFFYLYIYFKKELRKTLKVSALFGIILLSVAFAKNMHPQYLFWFISLFPLLKIKKEGIGDYLILGSVILIIALLTQSIYPLLYTQFIQQFYGKGKQVEIFYLQLTRNICVLILLILSFKYLFIKKTIE